MGTVLLGTYDHKRLSMIVQKLQGSGCEERALIRRLADKLARSVVLPPEHIPENVVTLYTTAEVEDLAEQGKQVFTLVFPKEASQEENRISILTPVGIALLGETLGSIVEVQVPDRTLRLKITRLLYQPEAAGLLYV
jgi:regulator of nucleoside diphosphate kinase